MSLYNTPLRYPGGKQRLTPFVIEILEANLINGHYVEPYAGGAGVGIELLLKNKVQYIHLNDYSYGIYAFWYSILNYTEKFCQLISSASLTIEEWRRQKAIVKRLDNDNLLELGFAIFYLNRCNRSGVLNAGVIGGYSQQGNYKMDARFNRNELIRRIESIALFKNRIAISNFDAEFYISNYIPNLPENTLVYFDPPYFMKGSDLYPNFYSKNDHLQLSHIIQNQINRKWILSYDGVPDILTLYNERRHFLYDLQYSASTVYKGKEVFIFCDEIKLPRQASIKSIDLGLQNLIII